jgi:MraZ protein
VFSGEYAHTLDVKGRLTVPSRLREELAHGLVVARGFDPCLVIYPLALWQEISHKAAAMPTTNAAARAFNRRFFSGAYEQILDRLGRVAVPLPLRAYAGIEADVVVAGANTYAEVWTPQRWLERQQREEESLESTLSELLKMGVQI